MGYLERNSETLKTPGFSGFDSRVSGFSRVVIFGFGSGSGSKKVGLFARVSGFRVQIPITSYEEDNNWANFREKVSGGVPSKNLTKLLLSCSP